MEKKKRKFTKKKVKSVQVFPQKKSSKSIGKYKSWFKKYRGDLFLLFIPIVLFGIFIALILVNNQILRQIYINKVTTTTLPINKINPYPYVGEIPLLSLSAKAAIIVDSDSQVVIFSKNPNLRFPMASTAKIMTALTALDHFKDSDLLTVKNSATEGSILKIFPGEQFYFTDLLYAMLLPSANDAAVAIADNYPGGKEAFVKKMNEKANDLHLSDTQFVDPTGLEDTGDYTTVVDMARLSTAALQNKKLTEVTGTKQKTISDTFGKQYFLTNLNKLLGINGVTGIKTGTTEGAGEVLVTSAVRNGHTFIIVVMNSQDRFADTQALLNFIDQRVQFISPIQF